jgi:hypothetical protein
MNLQWVLHQLNEKEYTDLTPLFAAKEQLIVCRTPYVSCSVMLSDFKALLILSSKISCKSPAALSAKQRESVIHYKQNDMGGFHRECEVPHFVQKSSTMDCEFKV